MSLSQSLRAKLDHRLGGPSVRLAEATVSRELDGLLRLTGSGARFDSPRELHEHLSEGALLNVGVIASRALSVPNGEYVVWCSDAGTTMLVPTAQRPQQDGLRTRTEQDSYEVSTRDLLQNWNRLSRDLQEEEQQELAQGRDSSQDHFTAAPDFRPEGPYTFGTKVTRTGLWQAMQDRGIGVQELAGMVGVDKSTISRLLRKVQSGKQGDPGGRNPSVELATKVAKSLGVPIDMVMPPEDELLGNERVGTSGSGKGGGASGKGNPAFAQGNSGGSSQD